MNVVLADAGSTPAISTNIIKKANNFRLLAFLFAKLLSTFTHAHT